MRYFKQHILRVLVYAVLVIAIAASCTKNVDIKIPEQAQKLAVEANIETGQPPIVLLTKSQNFFGNIDLNNLGAYYVHDAKVTVTTETDTIALEEFCLDNLSLSPEQKRELLGSYGFDFSDSVPLPNICIYSIPDLFSCVLSGNCSLVGEEEKSYGLHIEAEGAVYTANTTIPKSIGIDSLQVRARPNHQLENDSMVAVFINLTVPATYGNFIRYWTKRNQEPFYVPSTSSVWDDKLFSGLTLALPMERGYSRDKKIKPEDYTYFMKGDTVTLKWANIDSKTYDFYSTLENDGSGSPFSNPIKVKTNIEGGAFGVWAGYASRYYTIIVPE